MSNQTFNIVPAQSKIDWVGRKVTGTHFGTIAIKSGILYAEAEKLVGGEVVVDTASIKIDDVTDPALNAQFAGHLASDDFFSTAQYPEAVLLITAVSGNFIKGDLTIKGITHSVEFAADLNVAGDTLKATGTIVIDRTKYGIKFRSGNFFQNLGDNLIYNDFSLTINLTAQAA
ncbi:YceI family protein [Paraflavitalea pollutisoli]|uniref:YceI family protein n=1 Tax=Paraflavitalea pollutisoli TaxID=3034143 RepID=UPI0023EDBE90|nr:YceI family protein [Paraflavitalea sp. H1-2-19X]